MARVKEFDENEVLDKALTLFRARGFKHTSFSDLVGELGVSRQSLYDTYGDKHTLYVTALRKYLERSQGVLRRTLTSTAPVRPLLKELFEGIISANCDCGSPGCFMVNAMVELAPHDGDTRALAQAHAREVEGYLVSCLSAAQSRGELERAKDPAAIGRFLYNTILGLSVASRGLGDRESLRQTVAIALQVLD